MQPDVAVQQSKNGRVWEKQMTTYDDREKAYENKFALDQDLKFKAEIAPQQDAGRVGRRQARHHGRRSR